MTNTQRTLQALVLGAIGLVGSTQGQALGGIDPTSYFGSDSAERGSAQNSAEHDGQTYWFASAGDQRAFEREPARYAPIFGGHDPVRLAGGEQVAGNPEIFSVVGERVFLFESAQSRDAWLKDPAGVTRRASGAFVSEGGVDETSRLAKLFERNTDKHNLDKGLAVSGYDPVAYFREGGAKAKKGSKSRTLEFDGATYRFSSEHNRDRFRENPTRYEPAHGGWCSYAAAKGSYAEIDPQKFLIEDDRLLLFYNGFLNDTKKKWEKSKKDLLPDADRFWKTESGETARKG